MTIKKIKKKITGILLAGAMIIGIFGNAVGAESLTGGYSQHDVTVSSTLTEEHIRELLPTRMKSLAHTIWQIDNSKTPINALFLMSIVSLETGNGTSCSYRARNNVGGVMGRNGLRTFKTKADCLWYMHSFLNRGYINYGRKSVWRIGSKYCVGGNWANKINKLAIDKMYKSHIIIRRDLKNQ